MIKKSLKRRIDLSFLLIAALTLILIGVFNLLFIKKVYVNNKKNILTQSYDYYEDGAKSGNMDDFSNYCAMNGQALQRKTALRDM